MNRLGEPPCKRHIPPGLRAEAFLVQSYCFFWLSLKFHANYYSEHSRVHTFQEGGGGGGGQFQLL